MKTIYTEIDDALFNQLKKIKLLVCDVDGVFSDGRIYLGNQGEELKAFHTRDGYGLKALISNGVDVAVITGRRSNIVSERMRALNVRHIIQGEENKRDALASLMADLNHESSEVAAIGDDMPDTGMYTLSDVRIAVADAHPLVRQEANWITTINGGYGAIREVCDTILLAQNNLKGIQASSV